MCNSDSHIKLVVAVVTLYTLSDAARGSSNNNDTTVLVHILIEALVALLSEQYDATHVSHVSYHIHTLLMHHSTYRISRARLWLHVLACH
jgi:hypothetical protein